MPLQKFDWFWRSSELTQVIAHLLKWNDERDFETGSGTQKFDDGMGVTKLKSYDFGRLGHAQPVNPILGGVEQTLVGINWFAKEGLNFAKRKVSYPKK